MASIWLRYVCGAPEYGYAVQILFILYIPFHKATLYRTSKRMYAEDVRRKARIRTSRTEMQDTRRLLDPIAGNVSLDIMFSIFQGVDATFGPMGII